MPSFVHLRLALGVGWSRVTCVAWLPSGGRKTGRCFGGLLTPFSVGEIPVITRANRAELQTTAARYSGRRVAAGFLHPGLVCWFGGVELVRCALRQDGVPVAGIVSGRVGKLLQRVDRGTEEEKGPPAGRGKVDKFNILACIFPMPVAK